MQEKEEKERKIKINNLFCILGIVFGLLNIIDLVLTLSFISAEINPLVLNNGGFFYSYKLFSSWIILSFCWWKYESFKL